MISGSRYTQINNKGKNIYAFHANEKLYTIMEQLYRNTTKRESIAWKMLLSVA